MEIFEVMRRMSTKEILSVIAGGLFVISFVPYVLAILRKETKPAKASWIIWATVDSIVLTGMYFKSSVNGQIIGAVVGASIVSTLACIYGTKGWTKLDKFCLGGAAIGIVLLLVGEAVMSIVAGCVVIFIGAIPTFVSAWEDPSRENRFAWTMYWISCVVTMFAIPDIWTFANATQPIVFLVIESIMMYILYVRAHVLATAD